MNPLISVIIPVYNVEKYLYTALDSVINQTYKNLEIICIEDCSTDLSMQILNEFAKKDNRITIIKNTENKGVGFSRNKGLQLSQGEYIHFFDSDDWLELDLYQKAISLLEEDTEILSFNHNTFFELTNKSVKGYRQCGKLLKKCGLNENAELFPMFEYNPWSKLFKKKFLIENNILFNDYKCMEDVEFSLKTFINAKHILYTDEILYNYRANRNNSLTTKHCLHINYLIESINNFTKMSEEINNDSKFIILSYLHYTLINLCKKGYDDKQIPFNKMKEIFTNNINFKLLAQSTTYNNKYIYMFGINVLSKNKNHFFLIYNTKEFIKKNFPTYTNMYFRIKKGIHKLLFFK